MKTNNHLFKKLTASLLVGAMVAGTGVTHAFASGNTARTVSVFQVTGDSVYITRGRANASAREGQRLNEGNQLRTGRTDSAQLLLDGNSVLLMDSDSHVSVGSTGNRLSLTVESGQTLVNAGVQAADQDLEIRVGSRGLTVRGTLFTIGQTEEGVVLIVMLSGAAMVDGVDVIAGDLYLGDPNGVVYQIIRGFQAEDLDSFTLNAIINNADYLVNEAGTFTPEMIANAQEVLESGEYGGLLQEWAVVNLPAPEVSVPVQPATPTEPEQPEQEATPEETTPPPALPAPPAPSEPDAETDTTPEPESDSETDTNSTPDPEPEPETDEDSDSDEDSETEDTSLVPTQVNGVWQIANANHIQWLRDQAEPRTMHVALVADITVDAPIPSFAGTFDGGGRTITLALLDDTSSSPQRGLFGILASGSTVGNLNLTGRLAADMDSGHNREIGSLAGVNNGTITNVSSNVVIDAENIHTVGGLVGTNSGNIANSYVTGQLSGSGHIGGIAGSNEGSGRIENSVSNIRLDTSAGPSHVGVIAGQNSGGTIQGNGTAGNQSGTGYTSLLGPQEILNILNRDENGGNQNNWMLSGDNTPVLNRPNLTPLEEEELKIEAQMAYKREEPSDAEDDRADAKPEDDTDDNRTDAKPEDDTDVDSDEIDKDEADSDETDSDEADSDETDKDEVDSDKSDTDETDTDETDTYKPDGYKPGGYKPNNTNNESDDNDDAGNSDNETDTTDNNTPDLVPYANVALS